MRTRTEIRRHHILDQAAAVFRESGYERASMAQIAARVGGSKTTLYGYFPSKQDLFVSVMIRAMTAQSDAMIAMMDAAQGDLRPALLSFGKIYLDLVLSEEIIEVTRIGMAGGGRDSIGRTLHELGPAAGWSNVAERLQGWIDRGLLRPVQAGIVAAHLRALLEAGLVEPLLYGTDPGIARDEALAAAVDAFLRAYATAPPFEPPRG